MKTARASKRVIAKVMMTIWEIAKGFLAFAFSG